MFSLKIFQRALRAWFLARTGIDDQLDMAHEFSVICGRDDVRRHRAVVGCDGFLGQRHVQTMHALRRHRVGMRDPSRETMERGPQRAGMSMPGAGHAVRVVQSGRPTGHPSRDQAGQLTARCFIRVNAPRHAGARVDAGPGFRLAHPGYLLRVSLLESLHVMPALVAGIHVLLAAQRCGCPRRQVYAACASLAASAGMTWKGRGLHAVVAP